MNKTNKSTELMYEADHYYTSEETIEEAMKAREVLDEIASLPNAPRPVESGYEDIPQLLQVNEEL